MCDRPCDSDAAHIESSANYFAKAQALSQLERVGVRKTRPPRMLIDSPANGHPMSADSLERDGGREVRIVSPTHWTIMIYRH
jgi:hypothetical protein